MMHSLQFRRSLAPDTSEPSRRQFLALSGALALTACGGGGGGGNADGSDSGPSVGRFTATASMTTPRRDMGMAPLLDGRVLVVGGLASSGGELASTEIFNPASGTWSNGPSLATSNSGRFVIALATGSVLAVGGGSRAVMTESFNPATNSWTRLADAPQYFSALYGTLTRLLDGRVLALSSASSSAMLYSPGTNQWESFAGFDSRVHHEATLLDDGRVLVTGGYIGQASNLLATTLLFNPATGSWAGGGNLRNARSGHHAALLPSGRVLVSHGTVRGSTLQDTSEIYDPLTGTVGGAGNVIKFSPSTIASSFVMLAGRYPFVTGGGTPVGSNVLDQTSLGETNAEVFNPATSSWQRATSAGTGLVNPRRYHASTALAGGAVLVAGGLSGSGVLASAEIWRP